MNRLVQWALLLIPLDIAADLWGLGAFWLFLLSAAALVPLAYVIGEATEAAGEHTGPTVAGLLNASFGNAPELIIALFAVDRGLFEFVRGSLVGSVVSNLLLVLGVTIIAGRSGRLDRQSAITSLAQTTSATLLFLVPAAAHGWDHADRRFLPGPTLPVVVVLLVAYVVITVRSVRMRGRAHQTGTPGEAVAEEEVAGWSLGRSLTVLAGAAAATAFVSEVLTGSVEAFSRTAGLDDFFVAAVIVAIVGNAAEHGGAIVIAVRGKLGLATEIAFSSSAQVALFVIPAVVLLSLAINPLPLAFRPAELAAMGLAVVVPAVAVVRGNVTRADGAGLCLAYAAVVAGFYAVA